MQIDLSGRTALVTGGSRGLGRAVAERLAKSGARVVILARRPDVLEAAVSELRGSVQAPVHGYPCDVSRVEDVSGVLDKIEAEVGGVDILVNNAGSSARRPFAELDRPAMLDDLGLKLFPAVDLARRVIGHMKAQRWGRIINVVSIFGKTPQAGSAPTSVSRAAGIALTKVMAGELGPHGILVNALCVGLIRSDQWPRNHSREAPELGFEEYLKRKAADIPLGRLGEAEEFANVACFLASDAASYVNGVAINVDGGRSPVV